MRRLCEIWVCTVRGEMKSRVAICRLVMPCPTSSATCSSVGVRLCHPVAGRRRAPETPSLHRVRAQAGDDPPLHPHGAQHRRELATPHRARPRHVLITARGCGDRRLLPPGELADEVPAVAEGRGRSHGPVGVAPGHGFDEVGCGSQRGDLADRHPGRVGDHTIQQFVVAGSQGDAGDVRTGEQRPEQPTAVQGGAPRPAGLLGGLRRPAERLAEQDLGQPDLGQPELLGQATQFPPRQVALRRVELVAGILICSSAPVGLASQPVPVAVAASSPASSSATASSHLPLRWSIVAATNRWYGRSQPRPRSCASRRAATDKARAASGPWAKSAIQGGQIGADAPSAHADDPAASRAPTASVARASASSHRAVRNRSMTDGTSAAAPDAPDRPFPWPATGEVLIASRAAEYDDPAPEVNQRLALSSVVNLREPLVDGGDRIGGVGRAHCRVQPQAGQLVTGDHVPGQQEALTGDGLRGPDLARRGQRTRPRHRDRVRIGSVACQLGGVREQVRSLGGCVRQFGRRDLQRRSGLGAVGSSARVTQNLRGDPTGGVQLRRARRMQDAPQRRGEVGVDDVAVHVVPERQHLVVRPASDAGTDNGLHRTEQHTGFAPVTAASCSTVAGRPHTART